MHNQSEPIKVRGDKVVINQEEMFPYRKYYFRYLDVNMVAIRVSDPDRVELFQEVESGKIL